MDKETRNNLLIILGGAYFATITGRFNGQLDLSQFLTLALAEFTLLISIIKATKDE